MINTTKQSSSRAPSRSPRRLEGIVAVVTGAARGIGAAVVRRMLEEGASVVAVDVLPDPLTQLEKEHGVQVTSMVADISTTEGNQAAVQRAVAVYGHVDVFHANAAVIRIADPIATTAMTFDEVLAVNLKGVFLGCQAVIPHMLEQGGGSLIFTASVLGIVGDPELAAYGAAKGGLRALCRSLAVAYGPRNIRCNTICPADVRTDMFTEHINSAPDPKQAFDKVLSTYPLRRIAEPVDVANAAVFLASDESRCITGADLLIDCGLLSRCY